MISDDEDILNNNILRSARPPGVGTRMNASSGGRISSGNSSLNTVVDEDGKVRRRWQPGDSWSNDYFFGGDDI